MANLYFSVWKSSGGVALGPVEQEGTITIGAASAQGAVIAGESNHQRTVRLFCDSNAFVAWGTDPTAAIDGSSGMPMGAENPEYIQAVSGDKIAVIAR